MFFAPELGLVVLDRRQQAASRRDSDCDMAAMLSKI
jgi:hypothetical protein